MLKLSPIQKFVLRLWLRFAAARMPRHVTGGVAWVLGLPPLAGGSGGDDGTGGQGGAGGGEGAGSGGEGGAGSGAGAGAGAGGGQGGQGAGQGDGLMSVSQADWDNLQRQNRENNEALTKLRNEEAERQRKADEEAGNHAAIAERERKAREEAEQERDRLRETNERDARVRTAERVANRLKFRDPGDAMHRLSEDQLSSEAKIEKALKAIATEKPYLIDGGETPRQRNLGDGAGSTGSGGGRGAENELTGVERLAASYDKSKT